MPQEPVLDLEMKMTMRPFSFGTNGNATEGVKFTFRDWDFTHEATLMLKSDGAPRDDVHKDPLYALQGVPDGSRVRCQFVPYQRREQNVREGQARNQVRDTVSLRLHKVVAPDSTNGKG